uniref:Deoxynucleoside kinase domain-containing protein n=1 Tax=viral metagenome TaxID=1070528 RepID=A0A6C0AYK0_9ZZZZ
MKYIISIEGNIGSGKSTLINLLKEYSLNNVIYLPEPVDTWNQIKDSNGITILEKYYQDSKRYAFPFQMMAYITRLSLIRKAIDTAPDNSIILTERSIYTDREIFAKMLYDSGKIEDIEYSIYLRWFEEFSESKLDGIIYVQTTPDTCVHRIEKRNRKGEESIPLEYLSECHRYHENWINSTTTRTLFLDGQPEQSMETAVKINDFLDFFQQNSRCPSQFN